MSNLINDFPYLKSLKIKDLACFKGEHILNLYEYNNPEKPAMFTVILGNNNTGKTTLLKALASFVSRLRLHTFLPKTKYNLNINFFNKKDEYINYNEVKLEYKNENENKKTETLSIGQIEELNEFDKIIAYGTDRKIGNLNLEQFNENIKDRVIAIASLWGGVYLLNAEILLINLKAGAAENTKVNTFFELLKKNVNLIFSTAENIDLERIEFGTNESTFQTFVKFKTNLGDNVPLSSLGTGYQSVVTWVLDLAYRLFLRYPDSPNPLHEPIIVLVDELDLHLHPEWQRKVVKFLRELFPRTQFIVTTHSPILVQSADDINVICLRKTEDQNSVEIIHANEKFDTNTFEGWRIEEILQDFMLDDANHIYSDEYEKHMEAFEKALEEENYENAEQAANALAEILPPNSKQHKMLKIRMVGLSPNAKIAEK